MFKLSLNLDNRLLWKFITLSGIGNIAFATGFFYLLFHPTHFRGAIPFSPNVHNLNTLDENNISFLKKFSSLTLEQVVPYLQDTRLVEEGYTVRDLALSAMCSYHFFDIQRALEHPPLQIREFSLSSEKKILLFPALESQDFDKINQFLKKEKCPLTHEGLFAKLKENITSERVQVFIQSDEFMIFETLFRRAHKNIKRKMVFDLVLEGNWDLFKSSYEEIANTGDFSVRSRCQILKNYLNIKSKTAALLFLTTDFAFAVSKLSDQECIILFQLIEKQSQAAQNFAVTLLSSSRSDKIHQAAKEFLGGVFEEEVAKKMEERPGIGKLRPLFREAPPASPSPRTHIVNEGETLWMISLKYHLSLEALIKANHLQTHQIHPGQILKLPAS